MMVIFIHEVSKIIKIKLFYFFTEPALKAVFELSITHDASYNAVANMPGNEIVK
jgi:aminopeptidase N